MSSSANVLRRNGTNRTCTPAASTIVVNFATPSTVSTIVADSEMMKMTGDVHSDLKKMKLQGTHRVTVGCITCHHGRPTPATLVEELGWTYETSGIDSTVAQYQALRTRFYGRNAYDFGEGSLIDLGESLSDKGKHEDAIRVNQLNVEQNPNSARAQDGLAEAYAAAGQKDQAIAAFKKALELDPKDRMAQHRLEELSK